MHIQSLNNFLRKLPLLILLIFCGEAHARETAESEKFECPFTLPIQSAEIKAADLPAETRLVSIPTQLVLESIAVYDGPPEHGGALKPQDADGPDADDASSTWSFEGDYPDGKWLVCEYGSGLLKLGRRLDDHRETCVGTMWRGDHPAGWRGRFDCR
ncbi:hypothetical protein FM069_08560 [Pseudomonas mangiferae]|uniref:Uncharacterized protein n=2 Tax=Pseudomonas mangiferae TaxID=2593654 RepID=A0A553H074_9PSED|nr:hypothetical protein FM069_08560 [Pseudomonas mangiferae]